MDPRRKQHADGGRRGSTLGGQRMTPLPGTLTPSTSRHCSQVHPDTCALGACSPHAAGAVVQGKWCSGPSLQTRRVRDRRNLRPQETRHVHGAQDAQQTALKAYLWEARVTARNCLNKQLFFISSIYKPLPRESSRSRGWALRGSSPGRRAPFPREVWDPHAPDAPAALTARHQPPELTFTKVKLIAKPKPHIGIALDRKAKMNLAKISRPEAQTSESL